MMQDAERVLTPAGYERLKAELEYLRTVRLSEVAERLKAGREIGAWDSPDQAAAKEEQAFIAGRIAALERLLADANVVAAPTDSSTPEIRVGSTVVVMDEDREKETYTIVGSMEAEPSSGLISNESPVGRALLGHHEGDTVEVETPGGAVRLTVVRIERALRVVKKPRAVKPRKASPEALAA